LTDADSSSKYSPSLKAHQISITAVNGVNGSGLSSDISAQFVLNNDVIGISHAEPRAERRIDLQKHRFTHSNLPAVEETSDNVFIKSDAKKLIQNVKSKTEVGGISVLDGTPKRVHFSDAASDHRGDVSLSENDSDGKENHASRCRAEKDSMDINVLATTGVIDCGGHESYAYQYPSHVTLKTFQAVEGSLV